MPKTTRKGPERWLRIRPFHPLCHREHIRECTRALTGPRWDIRTRTIRFTPRERTTMPARWRTAAIVALLVPPDIHAEVAEEEADTGAGSTTAIGKTETTTTAIGPTQDPGPDPEAEAGPVVAGRAAAAAEAARVVAEAEAVADLAAAAAEAGRVPAADGRAAGPTPSRKNSSKCPNRPPSTWLPR